MRLTLVISSIRCGGSERVLSLMANHWNAAGFQITVITLESSATDFYRLDAGIARRELNMAGESRSVLHAARSNLKRIRLLRNAIRESSPDAVISFLHSTNVLTILATRKLGIPVMVSERSDPRENRIPRVWELLRRAVYGRATSVVVQTASVRGWALQLGLPPEKIEVIHNPVFLPPLSPRPAADRAGKKRVGYMGRLIPSKGFEYLIDAFAACATANPDWELVIIGDGECRAELEYHAQMTGLARRIRFPGKLENPFPALMDLDIFVMTSLYEGFPNALLEAMGCGLPVISFDCPSGPADIIRNGENGILIPLRDRRALQASLASLMGDPGRRERLGAEAVKVRETFAIHSIASQWEAAIRAAGTGKAVRAPSPSPHRAPAPREA
jgi:glycosyltransferase involved in cell wall biosynthesis